MSHEAGLHTLGSNAYVQTRDGRKLHYMSKGAGEGTVVFESGMGISRSTFSGTLPGKGERKIRPAIVEAHR